MAWGYAVSREIPDITSKASLANGPVLRTQTELFSGRQLGLIFSLSPPHRLFLDFSDIVNHGPFEAINISSKSLI